MYKCGGNRPHTYLNVDARIIFFIITNCKILKLYNPRWEIVYYLGSRIEYDPPLCLLVLLIFTESGSFLSIVSSMHR
jgi:hypothetical protein